MYDDCGKPWTSSATGPSAGPGLAEGQAHAGHRPGLGQLGEQALERRPEDALLEVVRGRDELAEHEAGDRRRRAAARPRAGRAHPAARRPSSARRRCAACQRATSSAQPGPARALEHELVEGDVADRVGLEVGRERRRHRARPLAHVELPRRQVEHQPLEPLDLLARGQQQRLLEQLLLGGEPVGGGRQRHARRARRRRGGSRASGPCSPISSSVGAQDVPRAEPPRLSVHLFRPSSTNVPVRTSRRPHGNHLRRTSTRAGSRATGAPRRSTSPRTRRQWQRGVHRLRAQGRAVELRALLLGRGRGDRRPLALHRRRAARGAEVLPRHAAGRRGAPRGLLQPLHARRSRGVGGDDIGERLAAIEPRADLGLPQDLRPARARWPTSCAATRPLPTLAAAITLYHLVIEATLAQPGQHFITSYLERARPAARLPRGHGQRRARRAAPHRLRREAARPTSAATTRDCKRAVADMLREVIPCTAAVLVPPGWDRRYTEVFGFTLEEIGAEGAASLETKLRSAGLPMEELPGPADLLAGHGAAASAPSSASGSSTAGSWARRRARRGATRTTMQALFQMLLGGLDHARRADRARHDPVGLRRRRAVAPGRGQRRHARGAGPRRGAHGHDPVPLRGLGRPARRPRAPAQAGRAAAPAPEGRPALAVAGAAHVPRS